MANNKKESIFTQLWFWLALIAAVTVIAVVIIIVTGKEKTTVVNNNGEEVAVEAMQANQYEYMLDVMSEDGETGKVITINTDLPDDTVIELSLEGEDGTTLKQEAVVKEYQAVSEEFTNNGEALSGGYKLTVTVRPSKQNDAVLGVIGEKGENLWGALVKSEDGESYMEGVWDFVF